MSIAGLVRRMADAGATPELIAIAVEEIEGLQVSLDARRVADRDRKRAQRERLKTAEVTGQSEDGHGTVTGTVTRLSGQAPSPDKALPQTPSETNPNPSPPFSPPASRRGRRLAADFDPPEDWIEWAMTKRGWSRAAAIEESEVFARHWQAKPGKDACKLDWPKTWQNWVVNSRRSNKAANYDPERITV